MKIGRGSLLPLVALLIALIIIAIGVFGFLFVSKDKEKISTTTTTTTTTDTPTITNNNIPIPPLYPGVEWGSLQEGDVVFNTKDNETIKIPGYAIESTSNLTKYQEFLNYYKDRLTSLGWKEISYASGPEGEVYDYYKEGEYFTYGIQVVSENPLIYTAYLTYSK